MSYKVIKTIKGNQYLYLQTTFRAGGKVKTKSVYLGAVGGGSTGAGLETSADHTPPPAESITPSDRETGRRRAETEAQPLNSPQEAREDAQATQTPPQGEKPTGSPAGSKTEGRASAEADTTKRQEQAKSKKRKSSASADDIEAKIKVKINLERQKISQKGLLSVLKNQISTLQGVGLDTGKLGKIKLVYSSVNETEPRHKKSLLSSAYKVYLPAYSKGNRTKFLQEYRRAVAKQGLELVKSESPFLYSQIKTAFDESYKRTNQALSSYILATNDKNKSVKAFIIRFFGIYHGKFEAENVGLTDAKRESWVDEYAEIMGDISRRGYQAVFDEWKARQDQAISNEKRATTARFKRDKKRKWYNYLQVGYMERANNTLRRAIARRQAQDEAIEKVRILGKLYGLQATQG